MHISNGTHFLNITDVITYVLRKLYHLPQFRTRMKQFNIIYLSGHVIRADFDIITQTLF